MASLPKTFIREEQYLELDRAAERKSEYFDGEMYAMAGAGMAHNWIVANTIASLHAQLRGKPCGAIPSDMRLRVATGRRYAYPDVTVVCGKPELLDGRKDILLNPTVIIEVLSPSTEKFDRGLKFVAYTAIPSLRQYLLIASDHASVEVFTKDEDGFWGPGPKSEQLDGTVELETIGCRLALADIYERVDFAAAEASA
jgi:Uma2 family endonuclease